MKKKMKDLYAKTPRTAIEQFYAYAKMIDDREKEREQRQQEPGGAGDWLTSSIFLVKAFRKMRELAIKYRDEMADEYGLETDSASSVDAAFEETMKGMN